MWVDYNVLNPSNVTLIDGGIGYPFVKFRITSDPGMNIRSIFFIYFKENAISLGPLKLESFHETAFDVDF